MARGAAATDDIELVRASVLYADHFELAGLADSLVHKVCCIGVPAGRVLWSSHAQELQAPFHKGIVGIADLGFGTNFLIEQHTNGRTHDARQYAQRWADLLITSRIDRVGRLSDLPV